MGGEEGEGGVALAVGHGGSLGGQWDGFLFLSIYVKCDSKKKMACGFICHKSGRLRSGSLKAALIGCMLAYSNLLLPPFFAASVYKTLKSMLYSKPEKPFSLAFASGMD